MRLTTIEDVKRQMATLYREARAAKVDSQDASRLANMLSLLARLIEGSDNEQRLAALEAAAAEAKRQEGGWQRRRA